MSFPRIRRHLGRFGLPVLQITSRAKTERQYLREVAAVDRLIEIGDRDGLRLLIDRRITLDGVLELWRGRHIPLVPKRDPSSGFVYIIARPASGELKIGFAKDVAKRLAGLQSSNGEALELVRAIPGIRALEYHAHGRFKQYRKRGEWYEDVPEIRDWEGHVSRSHGGSSSLSHLSAGKSGDAGGGL